MKLAKKAWWLLSLAIVATGVLIVSLRTPNGPTYQTVTVERDDLVQTVSVTGTVVPAQAVELGVTSSGRITSVPVDVGNSVKQGDILVVLDQLQLQAQLSQARAGVESASASVNQYTAAVAREQSKLDEMLRGPLPEQVALKRSAVTKAQQDLTNAYSSLSTTLQDAYNKSDDAIRIKTSGLFTGTVSSQYELSIVGCNTEAGNQATNLRYQSETELLQWLAEINQLTSVSAPSDWEIAIQKAESHLAVFSNFLRAVNDVLTASCLVGNASYDTYRSNITTARTAISTASTNISAAAQSIATLKVLIQSAQEDLQLTLSGTPQEQISAQRSALVQAQANLTSQKASLSQSMASVQSILAQIESSLIRAPFDGLITQQDAKVGQIASPSTPLVSLISQAQYEIEAYIPEADIAKVKIDDATTVTLDAYGNDVEFATHVLAIDPAETVIEGIATYKVTIVFDQKDARVKSGMTANIDIHTDARTQVLTLPQRVVTYGNGTKTVKRLIMIQNQETLEEVEVTLGLLGSDGRVEIIDGLAEGDKIVTK